MTCMYPNRNVRCQMSDVRGQGHGPWRYAYCTGAVHERPPTPRGRMCVPLTCRSAWTFTSVYTSQTLTPRATPCAWEIFALRGACESVSCGVSVSAHARMYSLKLKYPEYPECLLGGGAPQSQSSKLSGDRHCHQLRLSMRSSPTTGGIGGSSVAAAAIAACAPLSGAPIPRRGDPCACAAPELEPDRSCFSSCAACEI